MCGLDGQSSAKDAVPSEGAAAMALKADLVFKRSESKCHQFCHYMCHRLVILFLSVE